MTCRCNQCNRPGWCPGNCRHEEEDRGCHRPNACNQAIAQLEYAEAQLAKEVEELECKLRAVFQEFEEVEGKLHEVRRSTQAVVAQCGRNQERPCPPSRPYPYPCPCRGERED